MTNLDMISSETPSSRRRLPENRQFTTVVYPPDMYRKIKGMAKRNDITVREQTLRLLSVALKTEDPGFSPALPKLAQDMIDTLKSDAETIGNSDRKIYPVGSLLDAARMIRKLATQIHRLRG